MNDARRCVACGSLFHPLFRIPNQRFCSALGCQRERRRRRRWQQQRLRSDPDYRDNQARAQAKWRARRPDYWRQYRAMHPAYRERNCAMQREPNARRGSSPVANMDASPSLHPLASGFYILRAPCGRNGHQEHYMIRRVVERGVSPERLAKALAMDVSMILKKLSLLDGICPEAAELLGDRQFSVGLARAIRKMKPTRQVECVELM